jgi:hypothetical protein
VIPARRSFEHLYGKPVVSIAEAMLAAWERAPRGHLFGVVNADIAPADIGPALDRIRDGEVHLFCRREIVDGTESAVYHEGFDLVLLRKSGKPPRFIADDDYAFGTPWWDLWLPLALEHDGYRVRLNTEGRIRHVKHAQRFSVDVWREKRQKLISELLPQLKASTRAEIVRLEGLRATAGGDNPEIFFGDAVVAYLHNGPPGPLRRVVRAIKSIAKK